MELREYRPEDCREMAELFYETVHTVNPVSYTHLAIWRKPRRFPMDFGSGRG